ncbi:MAG: DUF1622 domain-containing protein [Actinomycetales bacterium]|nr:DUF1622 domain-containing protein [Actinomycetales bacterium]
MSEAAYTSVMLTIAQLFEVIAALVLLAGLAWAVTLSLGLYRRTRNGQAAYGVMRQSFGGAILLGLEILVAGDLIRTVAVAPTLENVAVLGIIVVIRTFLSFSLEVEIEGTLPWRRAVTSGAAVMRRAHERARLADDGSAVRDSGADAG